MSLARLVVTAVRLEGRTKAEVSRDYGVSPRWVYELVRRFDAEGEAGLEPRSRRPHRSPRRTSELIEDQIVGLRKELADLGVDAGAHTIAVHLARRHGGGAVPSVATIWRILSRRGFVTPQPQKRPRSSFIRFEAQMPNERWQAASDQLALILAVCATAGALLSMASKDRIAALGLPPPPERRLGFLLGGRDGRLLIVAVCAVVGQPVLALGAVVLTSVVSLGLRGFSVWSGTGRSD